MFETALPEKDPYAKWGVLAGVAAFAAFLTVGYMLVG